MKDLSTGFNAARIRPAREPDPAESVPGSQRAALMRKAKTSVQFPGHLREFHRTSQRIYTQDGYEDERKPR